MEIFISYAEPEGLALGLQAKPIFEAVGHRVWLWEQSRSVGAATWPEIAESIIRADRFLYICSRSSQDSYGQEQEYNIALNSKKEWVAFRVDGAAFPPALTGRNYAAVSTDQFPHVCKKLAETLRDLEEGATKGRETEKLASVAENRDDYVRQLRTCTEKLDRDRVRECLDEILRSYESATIPRRLSRLCQVSSRMPGEFRRIGLWLRGTLAKFNDPSYLWRPFSSELGHSVALGEQKYLYECITEQAKAADGAVSASAPDFSVLLEEIESLRAFGASPNVLLAPIQLMVPFYQEFKAELAWPPDGEERLTLAPGVVLRVFWSNGAAPLDRFVAFNSDGGLWSVKPDPETGHALTVALGQSKLYPDEVEWVAETVVKYEITNPELFRAVPLEGQAKPPEEQARGG